MMTPDEAKEIASLWFGPHGPRKIDAIKRFRYHSASGLQEAKHYLEKAGRDGQEALVKKLCDDYVQNKQDLLDQAREDRRKLDLYINQLEEELYLEEYGEPRPATPQQ
jgi:hypothetical protein